MMKDDIAGYAQQRRNLVKAFMNLNNTLDCRKVLRRQYEGLKISIYKKLRKMDKLLGEIQNEYDVSVVQRIDKNKRKKRRVENNAGKIVA